MSKPPPSTTKWDTNLAKAFTYLDGEEGGWDFSPWHLRELMRQLAADNQDMKRRIEILESNAMEKP